jgi:hypothetical protein
MYKIKMQWDRIGENIQILAFDSRKERDAFLSGVEMGNGWDSPEYEFLNEEV